jgi:hypothetical protein
MANTSKSGTTNTTVVEESSIDPVIDGIETTNNNDEPGTDTTREPVGYINDGATPFYDVEETYKMVFVGYAGDKKIYR